jgi:hypothetical protein
MRGLEKKWKRKKERWLTTESCRSVGVGKQSYATEEGVLPVSGESGGAETMKRRYKKGKKGKRKKEERGEWPLPIGYIRQGVKKREKKFKS